MLENAHSEEGGGAGLQCQSVSAKKRKGGINCSGRGSSCVVSLCRLGAPIDRVHAMSPSVDLRLA